MDWQDGLAQWIKVPATQPDLNSIPGTYLMKGVDSSKFLSCPLIFTLSHTFSLLSCSLHSSLLSSISIPLSKSLGAITQLTGTNFPSISLVYNIYRNCPARNCSFSRKDGLLTSHSLGSLTAKD